MTELRTRMIRDMTLRGFSPRTHESYIAAVVHLARHYRRSPEQLTNEEVQAYLLHLVQHRKLGAKATLAASGGGRPVRGPRHLNVTPRLGRCRPRSDATAHISSLLARRPRPPG
jgi:hypothetical protein